MREMKDSGIEWIGKIPHCWNTSKLKYLGQYINGYAFKPEEWGSKGVPIIRIQDLTGSNDNPNYFEGQIDKKYGVENGDILISWAATLDAFIWNKGNGWLNQHIFKAVPNRRIIDYDFFFWMIKESMKNMNNDNKHGIFMQHVTLSVFNNFTIPMPPLAEQHRIAAFLDRKCAEIDTVLEKTRASIEEYKKLKQAVITQAVTKGVRGDRPMKDSGIEWIGEIPAEWGVVPHKRIMHKVKEICEQYNGEDIISLTVNGAVKRDLTAGGKMPTSFDGYQYVEPNDLLLCLFDIDVTPRCVGVVRDYGVTSPAYSRFVMHDGYYNAYYDYLLRMIDDNKVFVHLSKNLRSSLTESDFGAIKTCAPPLAEQKCIAAFLDVRCDEIDALIAKKQQYLTEIENYKKSLIYEYVTGKKEVV